MCILLVRGVRSHPIVPPLAALGNVDFAYMDKAPILRYNWVALLVTYVSDEFAIHQPRTAEWQAPPQWEEER
jgi:hypothetical protein